MTFDISQNHNYYRCILSKAKVKPELIEVFYN
jgi:hypothetical protein